MVRRGSNLFLLLCVVVALYFVNYAFAFVALPEFFSKVDKWIIFIGGLLLVIAGVNSLKLRRYRGY